MTEPEYRDELITGDGTRDWARFDVSHVPHQGGYVAKQCPVRAQNDFLQPTEPLPLSAASQRRIDAGIDFEVSIAEKLISDECIEQDVQRAEREKLTREAMEAGAELICGGRLPADNQGRRVGEPDLLAKETTVGSKIAAWSYRPIDIKHHLTLKENKSGGAVCSSLAAPRLDQASPVEGQAYRRNKGDLMQLAHYQRMLENCGWAATDGRWGGIIGKEQRVVWTDLDAKIWRTPAVTRKTKMRSTIHVYDFEFAFRLDILAAAIKYNAGQGQDLLVVPVRNSECPDCPWKDYCDEALQAGAGDISLIPGLGWNQWKVHRDTSGLVKRNQLAGLDWATADLITARIDVASLLEAAAGQPGSMPLSELVSNEKRVEALHERGMDTVADLGRLSPATAQYGGLPVGPLAKHIDLARAALSDIAAFRHRGIASVEVPRADIEIDVDMENTDDGAYLWGALLTDRSGAGVHTEGYRAFYSWTNDVSSFESVFREFWNWLNDQREQAESAGLSFRAYCYHAVAENTQMLNLAGNLEDQVRAFITSNEWVDLLSATRRQLLTGGSLGLKEIAPLAEFGWAANDAGGDQAMVMFDVASSDNPKAGEAQEWLLEYNRNDVEATLAIRDWLETTTFPSIEDLDEQWRTE